MPITNAVDAAHRWALDAVKRGRPDFDVQLAFEILTRSRQLRWLYAEIQRVEREFWEAQRRARGDDRPGTNYVVVFVCTGVPQSIPVDFAAEDQLRLLVEEFYFVSHRLLTILDQCQARLPGTRPVPAVGIRRVRNNLIEHANKPGGRSAYTYSVSTQAGVRLRSAAPAGEPDTFLDEGIHRNASTLADEVVEMFNAAS